MELRKQSIDRLDINTKTSEILKKNNINSLEKLCSTTKTNLKEINLEFNDIKKIEVELQLLGLNLKNNP